jgi:hypothetical protein
MTQTKLEALYASATRLYPCDFRRRNAVPMRQAFHDALEDPSHSHAVFLAVTLCDLATSLLKEHVAMLRDTFARPVLIYNALVLAALASGLALALNVIPMQVLRLSANDPQIAMAGDLAARLESGVAAAEAVPSASVDMARSLSPFVIVYDDAGHPVVSQARLNGSIPAPPMGVFDSVRQHGQQRISWQPIRGREHGVRIAAVIERVSGSNPGFILAGRNMREVEAREGVVGKLAALTWFGMIGVIVLGTAVFGWYTRPRTA